MTEYTNFALMNITLVNRSKFSLQYSSGGDPENGSFLSPPWTADIPSAEDGVITLPSLFSVWCSWAAGWPTNDEKAKANATYNVLNHSGKTVATLEFEADSDQKDTTVTVNGETSLTFHDGAGSVSVGPAEGIAFYTTTVTISDA